MTFRRRPKERTERGDTLIEVLIAVVIIAIAIGPLLGALIESITGAVEHRKLTTIDTLLESFAETAKSELELSPTTPFTNTCKSTPGFPKYHLLSRPLPLSASATGAVSVFGVGFHPTVPIATFHIHIATGSTFSPVDSQSQAKSDAFGNMEITFRVPPPPTVNPASLPQSITISDGHGTSITSAPNSGLMVESTAAALRRSPVAGYRMGVVNVEYWNPSLPGFQVACPRAPGSGSPLHVGVQLMTARASAPGGVANTLAFIVRDPAFTHTTLSAPLVSVSSRDVALPTSGATKPLTFTATVATVASHPATLNWTVGGPTGYSCVHCPSSTQSSTGNSEVYTFALGLSTTYIGQYAVTATYNGNAYSKASKGSGTGVVYSPNGSGTMTVAPNSEPPSSSPDGLKFTYRAATGGTGSGILTINVPPTWSPPQATNPAGPGYVSASGGTGGASVSVTAAQRTIEVSGVTLSGSPSTASVTVTYVNVTAPASANTYTFATSEASVATTTPKPLSSGSPHVTVP